MKLSFFTTSSHLLKLILLTCFILIFSNFAFSTPNTVSSHPGVNTVDECRILFSEVKSPELSCNIYTSSLYILEILEQIDTNNDKSLEEQEKNDWIEKYRNTKELEINNTRYYPTLISYDIPDYQKFITNVEEIYISTTFAINYEYPSNFFEQENQVKLFDRSILPQAITTFIVDPESGFFVNIEKYSPIDDNRFNYYIFPKSWREIENTKPKEDNRTKNQEKTLEQTNIESFSNDLTTNNSSFTLITEFRKSLKEGSILGYIFLIFITTLLGMIHALQPGHGKAFISAIMIQNHSKIFFKSVVLGISTTFSHIFVVLLIGVLYYLTIYTPIFPWLKVSDIRNLTKYVEIFSYIAIIAIGITLTLVRYKTWVAQKLITKSTKNTKELIRPKQDYQEQNLKSLVLSGISGGINPCIEAITVLLIAIGIGQFIFGVILVGFFSLGMSLSLIGLANLVTSSKTLLNKFISMDSYIYLIQLLSSIFILILGIYLLVTSLTR